jgi:hypothetical protein
MIKALIQNVPLVARRWDMRSLGEGFRGVNAEFNTTKVLTVAACIVAVCLAMLLFDRLAKRGQHARVYDSPSDLFRELCRIHRFSRGGRRLLRRLAADWGLTDPAILFVEPEFFNTKKLSPELQDERDRIEQIRHQLFGAL